MTMPPPGPTSATGTTETDSATGIAGRLVELDVQQMTCASCAARIQKKLNKLPGVQASVNYATEKAHLVVPPGLGVADLIRTIQQAGYDASVPTPANPPIDRAAGLRRRLTGCAALAIPVVVLAMIPPLQFPGWQWASLALATPVVLWGAWPFHKSALVNLRHGASTMDTLISLGTTAAYLWSLAAMLFGSAGRIGMTHQWTLALGREHGLTTIYFEASVGIICFILLGRYIEATSRQDAGQALRALAEVGARTVRVRRPGEAGEATIPIEGLRVGDEFVVRPGEKVATDGVVVEGRSALDNSVITGESLPVEVGPGSIVVGAAINTTGLLAVRATAVGADTQLAQMARLVELAQTGKSRTQDLADKISGVFVPTVIGLSALTLVAWLIAGAGATFAVTAAVAVLIISCPCALGLATPTALLAGSLRGAQLGILIRGPHALEQAHRIDTIAMDKTGTITAGRMRVRDVLPADGVGQDELLAVAARLESGSEHPIARAVADACPADAGPIEGFENIPGRGVRARLAGRPAIAGNRALLTAEGLTVPAGLGLAAGQAAQQGASAVFVALDGRVLGLLTVADELTEHAAAAVASLRGLGLRTVMITGDGRAAAEQVAARVGIDEVHAEVLPADKYIVIAELQAGGAHKVAMVGDGVNDAAGLAKADLGISMGSGTDAAIAASELTLMRHDLRLVVTALRLSRRTLNTIRGNLFWAFGYNVVAIPIAAFGYLTPMLAGAAMAFSSVFVVTNSLRLRTWRPGRLAGG